MSHFLRPPHYFSADHFKHEQETIFTKSWEFAGYFSDFKEDNQYQLIQRAGKEIILHHSKGEIRAFLNSCPHRFSKIHSEECGKKALLCPYHGWSFSAEGKLAGLPAADTFEQGKELRNDVRLTSFAIEKVGDFLFVKVDPRGPSLKEFFGDRYSFMESVAGALGTQLDVFKAEIDVNWKILIENSLEGYHVPLVHPTTIAQFAGMSSKREDIVNHDCANDLDGAPLVKKMHTYMTNLAEKKWFTRFMGLSKAGGVWPVQLDCYIHQLFFPNLTVTSFLGYSFHIQHFEALGPEKTRVHSRIYSSQFEGGQENMRSAIFKTMFADNVKFTHLVFKEDEGITLKVQAGLKITDPDQKPILSALESRIAAFESSCQSFYKNEVNI